MKKCFYYMAAICCIALVSCTKEADIVNPDGENTLQIRAFCDEELTKTTYQLSGDTYEFSWVKGDKIAVQAVRKSNGNFDDTFRFTNSAEAGPEGTFSAAGNANFDLGEYAFYPYQYPSGDYSFNYTGAYGSKSITYAANCTDLSFLKSGTAVANQEEATAAEYATVRLFGTIVEDATMPMRHIPLIGKKKGDTSDYYFKAATGVLKVNIKNLPASATQICLDAVDYALNGYFVFDTNGEIKESYKKAGYGQKYMNITTSGDAERSFFFPIPTGTIPAGKLTISVSDGTNILYSVTSNKDIDLTLGSITEIPAITVPGLKVKIHGPADDPKATIFFSGDVAYVKYSSSMTTDYGPGNTCSTSGTTINLPKGYNYKWPFQYQAYNSSNEPVSDLQVIYYYSITETGKTEVCRQFTSATFDIGLSGSKVPSVHNTSNIPTITFAVSDDATKGNIVVTEFCGVEGKVYGNYVDYQTASGTPKQGAPQIVTNNEPFCTIGENSYTLKESSYAGARFAVKTTLYGTPNVYGQDANLVCWGQYVGLSSSADWGPYVEYYFEPCSYPAFTVAGTPATVFGAEWDATNTDNDMVYNPSTGLYSKTFDVPAGTSLSFKVAKDHSWGSAWPSDNYVIEASPYKSTVTVNINASTHEVSHSAVYTSDYTLHVLPEIATIVATAWGTDYTAWGGYDFIKAEDSQSGSYTYVNFLIPDALIGNTADVYFKGSNNCEVLIDDLAVTEGVYDYYFRTDGLNLVAVTDPAVPEALPTGNKLWICIDSATSIGLHTYGGTLEGTAWDTPIAMTPSGGKFYGKSWFFLDISGYSGKTSSFVARIGYNNAPYTKQTTDITDGGNPFSLSGSLYFTTTDWTDNKLNWQLLN